jgi:hypothetical protein
VGLALGFLQGVDHLLGVEGGGWSKKRERGEGSVGFGLGLLFLLRSNQIRQGERVLKIFWTPERDPSRSLSSSWSVLQKKNRRERDRAKLG